jgi:hypothetical protein
MNMKNKAKGPADFGNLHQTIVTRILKGEGMASSSQRQATFDNASFEGPLGILIDKDTIDITRCPIFVMRPLH